MRLGCEYVPSVHPNTVSTALTDFYKRGNILDSFDVTWARSKHKMINERATENNQKHILQ